MMRPISGALFTSGVLAVVLLGCNAILDNEPASLIETSEGGGLSDTGAVAPPDTNDAGSDDSGDMPSGDCPAGQRMCSGACVAATDPHFGCGDPSCTPCSALHATAACQGGACGVGECDPGYADCNANGTDGCEADLSKATTCGACKTACGAAAPQCSPSGGTFQCTNGCTPAAPLKCGAECVDPNTSATHCGTCEVACPAVANATIACAAGKCGFTCKPTFHACAGKCVTETDATACGATCIACPVPTGGTASCTNGICGGTCPADTHLCGAKCVLANDPAACGATCAVCPPAPNATPSCVSSACGIVCAAGFGNCDTLAATGCEASFATDAANCGACGKPCLVGQTCVAGACTPAAPPPPPP